MGFYEKGSSSSFFKSQNKTFLPKVVFLTLMQLLKN